MKTKNNSLSNNSSKPIENTLNQHSINTKSECTANIRNHEEELVRGIKQNYQNDEFSHTIDDPKRILEQERNKLQEAQRSITQLKKNLSDVTNEKESNAIRVKDLEDKDKERELKLKSYQQELDTTQKSLWSYKEDMAEKERNRFIELVPNPYNEKKHYYLISIRSIDMFICTLCTENNYASTKLKNHNEHAWRLHKIGRTTPGVVKRIFSTSLFF